MWKTSSIVCQPMKTSPKTTKLENLSSDLRKYVDLRAEQAKLRTAEGLSKAVSQCLVMFIVAVLSLIIFILLSVTGIKMLDSLWGEPWGTVAVCALYLLIVIILCIFRKKIFLNLFKGVFSDTFKISRKESLESQIAEVGEQIKFQEQSVRRSGRALKKSMAPLSIAANIVSNKSNLVNALTLAAAVFSKIRNRRKGIGNVQSR